MVWSTNFGKMIGIFYCGRYENQFCLTAPYKLWIICQSQIQQKKISIQKGLPSCKIVSTLSNNKNMARVVHNKPGSLNRMLDSIDASHSTWNKNMARVIHDKPGSLYRMLNSSDASHSTYNKNMARVIHDKSGSLYRMLDSRDASQLAD